MRNIQNTQVQQWSIAALTVVIDQFVFLSDSFIYNGIHVALHRCGKAE